MNRIYQSCILILLGLCWTTAVNAVGKVVLYGDDDYPPYCFVENGQFKGMYIDILKKVAEKLAPQYQIELEPRPWTRALAELQKGVAFALFPPGLKKERPYIEPYSTPLYRETVVLFCNDDVMKTPRKNFPEDFVGLHIGVNAGFLLSERLVNASNAGLVQLEQVKGNDGNIKKLALKRVDCYASDRAAALYSAKQLRPYLDTLGFKMREAVELSGENTYIAYSMYNNPPYKADFVKKMNAAINEIKQSGEVEKIEDGYLR